MANKPVLSPPPSCLLRHASPPWLPEAHDGLLASADEGAASVLRFWAPTQVTAFAALPPVLRARFVEAAVKSAVHTVTEASPYHLEPSTVKLLLAVPLQALLGGARAVGGVVDALSTCEACHFDALDVAALHGAGARMKCIDWNPGCGFAPHTSQVSTVFPDGAALCSSPSCPRMHAFSSSELHWGIARRLALQEALIFVGAVVSNMPATTISRMPPDAFEELLTGFLAHIGGSSGQYAASAAVMRATPWRSLAHRAAAVPHPPRATVSAAAAAPAAPRPSPPADATAAAEGADDGGEALVRVCACCGASKPRAAFSSRQWRGAAANRTCAVCVSSGGGGAGGAGGGGVGSSSRTGGGGGGGSGGGGDDGGGGGGRGAIGDMTLPRFSAGFAAAARAAFPGARVTVDPSDSEMLLFAPAGWPADSVARIALRNHHEKWARLPTAELPLHVGNMLRVAVAGVAAGGGEHETPPTLLAKPSSYFLSASQGGADMPASSVILSHSEGAPQRDGLQRMLLVPFPELDLAKRNPLAGGPRLVFALARHLTFDAQRADPLAPAMLAISTLEEGQSSASAKRRLFSEVLAELGARTPSTLPRGGGGGRCVAGGVVCETSRLLPEFGGAWKVTFGDAAAAPRLLHAPFLKALAKLLGCAQHQARGGGAFLSDVLLVAWCDHPLATCVLGDFALFADLHPTQRGYHLSSTPLSPLPLDDDDGDDGGGGGVDDSEDEDELTGFGGAFVKWGVYPHRGGALSQRLTEARSFPVPSTAAQVASLNRDIQRLPTAPQAGQQTEGCAVS